MPVVVMAEPIAWYVRDEPVVVDPDCIAHHTPTPLDTVVRKT